MVTVLDATGTVTESTRPAANSLLAQLAKRLDAEGVRYSHWKGSFQPERVLTGEGDLDLLVDRRHVSRFERVLSALEFKRAVDPLRPPTPSVFHYYGLEAATGNLLHLHVYYRMVTGENLLENYCLPLEELALRKVSMVEGMPVTQADVALIFFVIRMMVKCAAVVEMLLMRAARGSLQHKLESLLVEGWETSTAKALEEWLPTVPPALFRECVQALRGDASKLRRFLLARRLRRHLRPYRRYAPLSEAYLRTRVMLTRGLCRLLGSGSRKDLASGGAVIAFIGLDASGKSTLAGETRSWLGKVFRVDRQHLGKPSSAWLTWLPNLGRRLVAWAAPHLRMSARQGTSTGGAGSAGLLYRLRMVMLAWDRRALATRLYRKAANGSIVLCDRYPSAEVGAIDGASLEPPSTGVRGGLRGYLARLENRLYRQIPPPDIVIRVVAPAAVAVERNRHRHEPGKEKSDSYITHNHRHVRLPSFKSAHTVEVNTNRSRAETIQELRRILWQLL
jgi:thymidylate kinase